MVEFEKKWEICTCFELVRSVLSGHTDAFGVLYTRTIGYIRGICFRVSHNTDTAEDLTSQTYSRAFEKLSYYQHDGQNNSFRRWISQIAVNISIDYVTRAKKGKQILDQMPREVVCQGTCPLLTAQAVEQRTIINQVIEQLPRMVRECIIARYIQGLKNKSICQVLQLTENQVEYYLDIGKSILRKKLKKLL